MTLFRRALWLASCGRDSAKIAHSITMTMTCVAERSLKLLQSAVAHCSLAVVAMHDAGPHFCTLFEIFWHSGDGKHIS